MPAKLKPITYEVDSNGCWICTSHSKSRGYPHRKYKGKLIPIGRYIYYKIFGREFSSDIQVLHKCDNRACINLDHLYLGTAQDNSNDASKRNRFPHTKLTDTNVKEIRTLAKVKIYTQREIAKVFGVNHQHISKIINNTRRKEKSYA